LEISNYEELTKPPTLIEKNSFLSVFQEIVNTYGVPRYKEINPTVFISITFPLLFGIMFGDIGHGTILFSYGIYLCIFDRFFNSKQNRSKFRAFRYLILLMGVFSVYCGFIYNDFFSLSLNLFGTCYQGETRIQTQKPNCVYSFGIDPVWSTATNELSFVNSFKMKMAILIGIVQMMLGLILKAFNSRYFKKPLDFYFEFIP
jgi:V-type H+-transporting ATPase subunit a